MGDAVEGDTEGGSTTGAEGRFHFDERTVGGSSEGAEDPVNALEGQLRSCQRGSGGP